MKDADIRREQIWLAVGSLMVLATVALAAALVYTRDVMIPFVLAIFITAVVAPLVDFQVRRWGFPTWLAVFTTLMLVLVAVLLVGFILIVAVQSMVRSANEYSAQVVALATRLLEQLKAYNIHVDQTHVTQELESLLPTMVSRTAGTVTAITAHGVLIIFFAVFLLAGRNPGKHGGDIYTQIETTVRNYITTLTVISFVTSLLVGIVLWALGLPMAWLFTLMVFAFTFIPSVGPIIATILPLPVAVAQFHSQPWMIVAVIAVPGAIHMLIGNLVTPKMMGRGMELHPVTVLLALAFWGLLWGIVGMILAVPIMAVLRIILSHFNTTRPIADLLAGELPGSAARHRHPAGGEHY